MTKRKDLTGQRFGLLMVEENLGDGKYRCRCKCGTESQVFGKNLTAGHTRSCGCLKHNKITGMRFGRLTVLGETTKIVLGRHRQFVTCLCDCGAHVTVRKDAVISGQTSSCGCLSGERDLPEKARECFVNGTMPVKIGALTSANKSGVVGVNWDKSRQKWQASIRYQGKKYHLGRYDDISDAITARKQAEEIVKAHIKSAADGEPIFTK